MSSWAPHSFRHWAEAQGCDPEFVTTLVKEGDRLRSLNVPVIFTLGHIASICDVPYGWLDKVVKRKVDPYRVFRIRKRTGGYRQICVPDQYLLRVQQWIHLAILKFRPLHPISTAFAPGCMHYSNAEAHSFAKWLVKIDVASFFESVSERQVYRVFHQIGYPALLSFQLCRICTRVAGGSRKYQNERWQTPNNVRYSKFGISEVGHLPQGAPTSPMLANLVCAQLDSKLQECASEHRCTVTRYADDIVFSASDLDRESASAIIRKTARILGDFGLVRRNGKTHVATPGSRRVVTGLVVDSDQPRLPKEYRERISLHLYHARTKTIPGHCRRRKFRSLLGFKSHLDGLITYAEQIEPVFGAKCRREFEALPWGDLVGF